MVNSSGGAEHVRRWEPMDGRCLPRLRLLAEAATRVEGDALASLEAIGEVDPGEDPPAAARELLEETGTTGVPMSSSPALVDAIDRVSPDGRPVTTVDGPLADGR